MATTARFEEMGTFDNGQKIRNHEPSLLSPPSSFRSKATTFSHPFRRQIDKKGNAWRRELVLMSDLNTLAVVRSLSVTVNANSPSIMQQRWTSWMSSNSDSRTHSVTNSSPNVISALMAVGAV